MACRRLRIAAALGLMQAALIFAPEALRGYEGGAPRLVDPWPPLPAAEEFAQSAANAGPPRVPGGWPPGGAETIIRLPPLELPRYPSAPPLGGPWPDEPPIDPEELIAAGDIAVVEPERELLNYLGGGEPSGATLSYTMQSDPFAFTAELGAYDYVYDWLEQDLSLAVLHSTDIDETYVTLNLGMRVAPPWRVAPFVGGGVYTGPNIVEFVNWLMDDTDSEHSHHHHRGDDEHFDHEHDDDDDYEDWIAGAYPEVGCHVWLSPKRRLTVSLRYHVTTQGRRHDFWMAGVAIGYGD